TGLSTTTTSSSSRRMAIPGTGSGGGGGSAARSGSTTSSQLPASSRSDLPSVRPSMVTAPVAASSAALVRLIPRSRARAASTRWPARPSGTGRARRSAIGLGLLLRDVGRHVLLGFLCRHGGTGCGHVLGVLGRLGIVSGPGVPGGRLLHVLGSGDVPALGGLAVMLVGRGTAPVHADAAEGEHRDADRGEHDRDVGHVAH